MFVACFVLALIILSAYLKFEPELPRDENSKETTAESTETAEETKEEEPLKGKLGQFLDESFENSALPKLAIFSLIAGILCFVPEKFAVVSLFASAGTVGYYLHVRNCYRIEPFPNGFLCIYAVFFGAAVCCAALRMKNRASEERKTFYVSELSALSSAIMFAAAALAFKLNSLTKEYTEYSRFLEKEENVEEKDFGDFEPILETLKENRADVLVRIGIVFAFLALVTLVLTKFPRISLLVPASSAIYVLYQATVGELISMKLVFFLLAVMATVAIAAIPATLVTPTEFPDPDEFDEDGSEDDGEDDEEYEEIKTLHEKNGKEVEEF